VKILNRIRKAEKTVPSQKKINTSTSRQFLLNFDVVSDDDIYARDPTESQIDPRSKQYDPEQYDPQQYQQYEPESSDDQYQPGPNQEQYQPELSQHQYEHEFNQQQYQPEPSEPAPSESLKAEEPLLPPQPQSTEA
jgi:hypothetical protein